MLAYANDNYPDRLLKIEDVEKITSLGKEEIQLAMTVGKFPSPVTARHSSARWRSSEIVDWIRSLPRVSSV